MLKNISLKLKLSLLCIGLVVIPSLIIGGFSFCQFRAFGNDAVSVTYEALTDQTSAVLMARVQNNRQAIGNLIEKAEEDTRKFASSDQIRGYLSARVGKNEVTHRIVRKEASGAAESILRICQAQKGLVQKKLSADMAVAEYVIRSRGGIEETKLTKEWKIVSEVSKEEDTVVLPILQVGFDPIYRVEDSEQSVPLVDKVRNLVGSTCSIFQRANPKGDMVRVATTAKNVDGKRAVGTWLPAADADGNPPPVIAAVLDGKPFEARTRIGRDWYISRYHPIHDEGAKSIGMLEVSLSEQENSELAKAILEIRIGQTGYAAVMDSNGQLIFHPRADLFGKNVITDLHLENFDSVLKNAKKEGTGMISYTFEGRRKFMAYACFEPWDWIIFATGYWSEFEQGNAAYYLENEIRAWYQNGALARKDDFAPAYDHIRYIDEYGYEHIALDQGEMRSDLKSVSHAPWFEKAKTLSPGEVWNMGVIRESDWDVMRIISPTFFEEKFMGVVVVDFNWELIWNILKGGIYGRTGYSCMINEKGEIISHPRYRLEDHVNIGDPKFAHLSEMLEKSRGGEKGCGFYLFENARKFLAYTPIRVGEGVYSVLATVPEQEFLSLANTIRDKTEAGYSRVARVTGITTLLLMLLSAFIGLGISLSLSGNVGKIIHHLTHGAERVNSAFVQIVAGSRQIAEGASEQATSLEETSMSLEEMSAMIRQNSEYALVSKDMMAEISRSVKEACEIMAQLAESMKGISKSAQDTRKIIRTIDEIAFQTKLLALNAAVEAARAGDAGMGFAVVAEEVRRLANSTSAAAKDTESLISDSVRKIQEGAEILSRSLDSIDQIGTHSEKAGILIDETSAAYLEISRGIEQIHIALVEMDNVTQQNAASAEEFATASQEVNIQAEQMGDIVKRLAHFVGGRLRVSGNGRVREIAYSDLRLFTKSRRKARGSISYALG